MQTYESLRDELQKHLKSAQAIADRAERERRGLTSAELREAEGHLAQARNLDFKARQVKGDDELKRTLAALDGYPSSGAYRPAGSAWARKVASQLTEVQRATGTKSLTTTGIDVPAVVLPTVELPAVATRLIDLIPTVGVDGNEYAYPRQTVRAPAAAVVPDNELKPTSPYVFEEQIERVRVIAHLSEPIPLHFFEDHMDLLTVLDGQMYTDVMRALEAQLVNGDGTGENFTGVLHTSGTVSQAFATNVVTTLRRARTVLANLGEEPTAYVLNPSDIEALDLLTDSQNRYYGVELDPLLGNLPRVPSLAVPQGTAILADWRQVRLFMRQLGWLAIDRSGELFDRNQCKLRVEMRAGLGVTRPQAVCVVDLTA